jgi:hypothetical protein
LKTFAELENNFMTIYKVYYSLIELVKNKKIRYFGIIFEKATTKSIGKKYVFLALGGVRGMGYVMLLKTRSKWLGK